MRELAHAPSHSGLSTNFVNYTSWAPLSLSLWMSFGRRKGGKGSSDVVASLFAFRSGTRVYAFFRCCADVKVAKWNKPEPSINCKRGPRELMTMVPFFPQNINVEKKTDTTAPLCLYALVLVCNKEWRSEKIAYPPLLLFTVKKEPLCERATSQSDIVCPN